jgi:hypothetical protein
MSAKSDAMEAMLNLQHGDFMAAMLELLLTASEKQKAVFLATMRGADSPPAGSCPSGDPIPGHICTDCPPEHVEKVLGKDRIAEALKRYTDALRRA